MKKIFTLFFALSLAFAPAAAQTPTEMQYQLLVLNPETGQVRTSEDVAVRLELRQGSATGQAVWSQDFSVRTDARGLCQLTLDFGSDIDWQSGNFYLASVIDGKECGAPKLTSVPYAMQAARLDGLMTAKELVGTWREIGAIGPNNTFLEEFSFGADGTGTWIEYYEGGSDRSDFKWQLTTNGLLLLDREESEAFHVGKISDSEIVIEKGGGFYRCKRLN